VRIAQLSSMTGFYGGEVHLTALAAALRARGHEVWGVVRPRSELARRLAEAGVPVLTLPLVHWYEPVGTLRLRAWLGRRGIDVLHSHVPRDWYTAAVATLGTGVVNVGTRHHLRPVGAVPVKRPFLGRFAAMTAVSEAVRAELLRGGVLPATRVMTVPNGVAAPAAPGDRAAARRALGLAADVPVVGFVGRLDPDKGPDVLLEAAARLRVRHTRLQVAVVGGDGDRRYGCRLRARAARPDLAGAVRWLGYRSDAAVLCRAFDVLAAPSPAEPFGLVLLEAMAQGVPVVAAGGGGVPEIVRDGTDGLLVPPGDPAALAAALARVLDDPDLASRLAAAGPRRVRDAFPLARTAALTEAVYRRALAARSGAFSPAASARPAPRHR